MSNVLRSASSTTRTVFIFAVAAIVLLTSQQVAKATVTEEVRLDLPIALDGEVWTVEQVGTAVVVGGNFTQVQTSPDGPIVDQVGIYAYDMDSGQFLEDFRPIIGSNDGIVEVRDLVPTEDGTAVYVGGKFTTIDDQSDGNVRVRNRIALLGLADGRLDRNFAEGGVDAKVLSMVLDQNGWLYVGGNFELVYDLSPERPPIEQAVRGLARFDAETGAFDEGFRYESQVDIGREFANFRTPGVVNLVLDRGIALFVAHRGAELHDSTRGQVFDSPGIGRIFINPVTGVHRLTEYKLLHSDETDPIQEFFHIDQCGGRGLQIRDMDVSDSFLVVVSQGADTGIQCDTATRFPTASGTHRPDWTARAFDSVFSVEIDGSDVYIGGHFRYLVNSSAPSPYPGETVANGAVTGNIYEADPSDPDFLADLIDPGYVFPVGQIGVLDATTGYANPAFLPQSDAFKGILDITAVDRGLLIGSDQSRVNGYLVGRSAFFDDDPTAGLPGCSVEVNPDGDPLVTWTDIGDVNTWNVAGNDVFVASVGGTITEFIDSDRAAGQDVTYELRYNRNGLSLVEDCGTVTLDPLTLTCTAVLDNAGVAQLSWNDEGWSRVTVFRNSGWIGGVTTATTFADAAPVGDNMYELRAFNGGERTDAVCSPVITVDAPEVPVLACTVTVNGADVVLTWNDVGAQSYQIRTGDSWTAQTPAGTTTFPVPDDGGDFSIRYRLNGTQVNVSCE